MTTIRCPHCASTDIVKNPFFLECAECGTRMLLDDDGTVRRTDAFGHGMPRASARPAGGSSGYAGPQVVVNQYHYGDVNLNMGPAPKSKLVAFFLCLFLGVLGAHYFYLGRFGMGLAYFFTLGLFGWGWLIDIFRILLDRVKDKNGVVPQ